MKRFAQYTFKLIINLAFFAALVLGSVYEVGGAKNIYIAIVWLLAVIYTLCSFAYGEKSDSTSKLSEILNSRPTVYIYAVRTIDAVSALVIAYHGWFITLVAFLWSTMAEIYLAIKAKESKEDTDETLP